MTKFDHFRNTRHERWTIVGVVDEAAYPNLDVATVEIYQPGQSEPVLVLPVADLPQFIAGLVATAVPGDLTAGVNPS